MDLTRNILLDSSMAWVTREVNTMTLGTIISQAEGIQMNMIQSKALIGIGVGNPPGSMDVKAFLLQKFSSVERKQIVASLEQGVEAIRTLVLNGFNDYVYRFNLGQKYKYHKV